MKKLSIKQYQGISLLASALLLFLPTDKYLSHETKMIIIAVVLLVNGIYILIKK